MKLSILKYPALLLSSFALLLSCEREPVDEPTPVSTRTIHYNAAVTEGAATRAALNGSSQYVFESGDQLYVENTGTNAGDLYGILTLVSGAGERTAVFEGDLTCSNDFYPTSSTPLTATLIGANEHSIHSFTSGKLNSARTYPDNEYASNLADAVSKYSDFTATSTYGAHTFTLNQQSAFLVFAIQMEEEEAPIGRVINASLLNNNTNPLRTASITVSEAGSVPFVLAFQGGEVSLEDAVLNLGWTDSDQNDHTKSFDDITNHTLAANNYYTISRTTIARRYGGFRIIALADGTITSSNIAGLQYSIDEGETWTTYSSGIPVIAGNEVCFRASAANTVNSKKIYSSAAFAIAGDIVSLLIGDNYGTPSPTIPTSGYTFVNLFTNCTQLEDASGLVISMPSIPGSAFKSFFEGCTNLVAGPAELPATSIGSTCYRNMFLNCNNLTSAPIIRKATTHNKSNNVGGWYQQMFKGCSKLQTIVFLDDLDYAAADFTDWVNGVNSEGTFYVPDKDNNNPFGNNRGNSAIPSGWTVQSYSGD